MRSIYYRFVFGIKEHRKLSLLFLGQALMISAQSFWIFYLTIWSYRLSTNAGIVGIVLVVSTVPGCIIGPWAGVMVDRGHRALFLRITPLLSAGTVWLPLIVPSQGKLVSLLFCAGIYSICSSCFIPAKTALVQQVLPENKRDVLMYWNAALPTVGFVVGGALAPLAYLQLQSLWCCLVMCLVFAVTTVCFVTLPEIPRPTQGNTTAGIVEPWWHPFHDMLIGARVLLSHRTLFVLLLALAAEALGSGVFNGLNLVFVSTVLSFSFYSIITGLMGVMTLLGSFLAGLLIQKIPYHILFAGGIFFLGTGIVAYAWQFHLLGALICIGIACLTQAGIDVGLGPILLTVADNEVIGRAEAALALCTQLMSIVAYLVASWVAGVDLRLVFTIAGLVIVCGGICGGFTSVRKQVQTSPTPVEVSSTSASS